MKQYPNKEQVLQEIEVLTSTISNLIWIEDSTVDPIEYQKRLEKLIYAKNDLQTYVLHNMVYKPAPEPTLEDKIKQLYEYLDTGSYADITYLIVQLLERIVKQTSKEE